MRECPRCGEPHSEVGWWVLGALVVFLVIAWILK